MDRSCGEMTRVATRYPGWLAISATWAVIGCLSWTRHYLNDREFAGLPLFGPDLLTWLACFVPWVLFTPLIFRFERRFPLSWRHGPVLAAAGPMFCLAAIGIWVSVGAFTAQAFGGRLRVP